MTPRPLLRLFPTVALAAGLATAPRLVAQEAADTNFARETRHVLAPEPDASRVRARSLADYEVIEIADTRTRLPGSALRFTEFGVPSLDGGTVAFRADGEGGQKGVYAHTMEGLITVADLSTPVPGGTGNFTFFGPLGVSGDVSVASDGSVAFVGQHASGRGVYQSAGGTLLRLVDDTFPVPGNPGGSFGNFFHISYDEGRVAFTAVSDGFVQGVYFADGASTTRIADTATPIPGGTGNFTDFGLSSLVGKPSLHGDEVVFVSKGDNRQSGVYLASSGSLSVVADTTTTIPGTSETFGAFGGRSGAVADIRDGDVVFNNGGIYVVRDGGIEKVADARTRIPAGFGFRFSSFGAPAIDDGKVFFQGEFGFVWLQTLYFVLKTGVYTDLQGPLLAVAARSLFERIGGRVVKEIASDAEGLADGSFAFKATFYGGREGIYVARNTTFR